MNNVEHIEGVADCIDCGCADCQAALKSFNAYIADVRRRWYKPAPNPLDPETGDVRDTSLMVKRCKRCRHTEAYAGPLLGDICGSCGDDLRQEADADRHADLAGAW